MSNLFPYKRNTLRLKHHSATLMISISLPLPLCSDGAGRSGTYILIDMVLNRMAKGNDQCLPFHSFCLRSSVALATLKPLIFHRGSWGCIRGWLFLRPGEAAKTREGAGRSGESGTKRGRERERGGKWKRKPAPTLVIIYLSYRHAILTCSTTATWI